MAFISPGSLWSGEVLIYDMMLEKLYNIPEGYSEGWYHQKKYGITKTIFNKGKSIKLYAEELGGSDFISLNYYITTNKHFLKPCEMPERKVMDFMAEVKLLKSEEMPRTL